MNSARHGIRCRDRLEIRVDSTRLIDTGIIDTDHAYAVRVEFATNWKNLYLQAEDFRYAIERREPTIFRNPAFGGFYLQGSWVLTGEPHLHSVKTASFQRPRTIAPISSVGGFGAWELALR